MNLLDTNLDSSGTLILLYEEFCSVSLLKTLEKNIQINEFAFQLKKLFMSLINMSPFLHTPPTLTISSRSVVAIGKTFIIKGLGNK